jgi:hypothetical protein
VAGMVASTIAVVAGKQESVQVGGIVGLVSGGAASIGGIVLITSGRITYTVVDPGSVALRF